MPYEAVMRLPIRTFWLMNNNVQRVQAMFEMRSLDVAISAQSSEGFDSLRDRLVLELGVVVTADHPPRAMETERDTEGFEALREMSEME